MIRGRREGKIERSTREAESRAKEEEQEEEGAEIVGEKFIVKEDDEAATAAAEEECDSEGGICGCGCGKRCSNLHWGETL